MGWVGGEHQTIRITDEDMHPLNEKIKSKKKKKLHWHESELQNYQWIQHMFMHLY